MAVELADAYISLVPSAKGIGKSIAAELGDVDGIGRDAGDRASQGFLGKFTSGLGGLAVAVGGAFAAIGIGTFLKGTIDAASDMNETVSKVGVIFGDAAGTVEKFASTSSSAFGQSKKTALDAAATFATFGKSAGLTGQDLAGFSTKLVGLSSDFGSFFNTSPEEAIEAIGAALRGESEPIRKYGILLDDATLRNRALQLGLIKTTKEALTPQNKVLAAQAEIMAQSSDAQGDFARTSDGLANKQRILSAQFEDVKAKIGQGLLPIMSALVGFVSDKVLPAFTGLGDKIGPVFTTIGLLFDAVKTAFSGEGVTSDGLFGVFERIGAIARVVFTEITGGFRAFVLAFQKGDGDITSNGFPGFMERLASVARDVFDVLSKIDWGAVFSGVVTFIQPIIDSLGTLAGSAATLVIAAFETIKKLFEDNRDAIKTVAEKLGEIAGVLRDAVALALSTVSLGMGILASNMGLVKAVAVPLIAAFIAYHAVVGTISAVQAIAEITTHGLAVAQAFLNGVLALNPIGLVVAALAALVLGVIYAYTHFEAFRNIVDTAWQILQGVFHWIVAHWELLLPILTGPFGLAILVVIKNFDTIKNVIMGVFNWIRDNWKLLLAIIIAPFALIPVLVAKNFGTIVGFFKGILSHIQTAINAIVTAFNAVIDAVQAAFAWLTANWAFVESLLTAPWFLAVLLIIGTWDTIKAAFTAVKDWIIGRIADIVAGFAALPGAALGLILDMYETIKAGMTTVASWLAARIADIIGFYLALPGQVWAAISGLYDLVRAGISNAAQWVGARVGDIVGFFLGIPGRVAASIVWIGDTIRNGIIDAAWWVGTKVNEIVGWFTGLPGRLANAFGGMFDGIANAFRSAINFVIDGWNRLRFGIPGFDVGPFKFGGFEVGTPNIARLAAGGIVTQATLALIGERGPEAVIPLDRFAGEPARGGVRDITINTLGKPDARELAREVAWQMKVAGR